jgi:hypothetical protein
VPVPTLALQLLAALAAMGSVMPLAVTNHVAERRQRAFLWVMPLSLYLQPLSSWRSTTCVVSWTLFADAVAIAVPAMACYPSLNLKLAARSSSPGCSSPACSATANLRGCVDRGTTAY